MKTIGKVTVWAGALIMLVAFALAVWPRQLVIPKGWQRALARPITDRHAGKTMRALYDARAYMVKLGDEGLRPRWQSAAQKLLDARKAWKP